MSAKNSFNLLADLTGDEEISSSPATTVTNKASKKEAKKEAKKAAKIPLTSSSTATTTSEPAPMIPSVKCKHCRKQGHSKFNCPLKYYNPVKGIDEWTVICYYCRKPGHVVSECDERCFRCDGFGHTHHNCPENTHCDLCDSFEHRTSDCIDKAKGHPIAETSDRICNICSKAGHIAKYCPEKKPKICGECKQVGHLKYECNQVVCHKCGGKGHISRDCSSMKPAGHI